jgi:hypothetical protein
MKNHSRSCCDVKMSWVLLIAKIICLIVYCCHTLTYYIDSFVLILLWFICYNTTKSMWQVPFSFLIFIQSLLIQKLINYIKHKAAIASPPNIILIILCIVLTKARKYYHSDKTISLLCFSHLKSNMQLGTRNYSMVAMS